MKKAATKTKGKTIKNTKVVKASIKAKPTEEGKVGKPVAGSKSAEGSQDGEVRKSKDEGV